MMTQLKHTAIALLCLSFTCCQQQLPETSPTRDNVVDSSTSVDLVNASSERSPVIPLDPLELEDYLAGAANFSHSVYNLCEPDFSNKLIRQFPGIYRNGSRIMKHKNRVIPGMQSRGRLLRWDTLSEGLYQSTVLREAEIGELIVLESYNEDFEPLNYHVLSSCGGDEEDYENISSVFSASRKFTSTIAYGGPVHRDSIYYHHQKIQDCVIGLNGIVSCEVVSTQADTIHTHLPDGRYVNSSNGATFTTKRNGAFYKEFLTKTDSIYRYGPIHRSNEVVTFMYDSNNDGITTYDAIYQKLSYLDNGCLRDTTGALYCIH